MSSVATVAKNSVWLVVPPLVLNIISIVATAYIARVLGQADYGRFVLAISFIQLFTPFANMGLRAVTVRHVAQHRDEARGYVSKMLAARFALALVVVTVIAIAVNLMGYDARTRFVVYLAALTLLSQSLSTTFQDMFQAFENMAHAAYSQFTGGVTLTILSVLVLYVGFGLTALTLTYVAGSVVTLGVAWYLAARSGRRPGFSFDWAFAKENLVRGAPFFYPSIVAVVGVKIGTILLSVLGTEAAVGILGAALTLVDRLTILPDGMCTALYPSLAHLYSKSPESAGHLFRRYLEYAISIGLPIAVGTTLVAGPLIELMFGSEFAAAAQVLRVLIWWFFITFLTTMQSWTLGAINQEKKPPIAVLVTTPLYVGFNVALIPLYRELGTAYANVLAACVSLAILSYFIKKHFVRQMLTWDRIARIALANAAMGAAVYPMTQLNLFAAVGVGVVTYAIAVRVFGVVSREEQDAAWKIVATRLGRAPRNSAPED